MREDRFLVTSFVIVIAMFVFLAIVIVMAIKSESAIRDECDELNGRFIDGGRGTSLCIDDQGRILNSY